jgi:hypothetical protein
MPYKIILKKLEGNEINQILEITREIFVSSLNIQEGFLIKGSYRIPINNILFIEEVT